MSNAESVELRLWSDDPAATDLLSFGAVAETVADALLDPVLDPVALGLSGRWGSGKTTVLALVEKELEKRASAEEKVLVVRTEPWRFDPVTGSKESLIGEVLEALTAEVETSRAPSEDAKGTARKLAARLARRVDWAKAIKLTAKTSLAFQLPSLDEITGLIKEGDTAAEDEREEGRGLEGFRSEFAALMASEALGHVQAVAVLVDDLDRCLPEAVIESLEAIRLFLAVPKMSFVIAADEDRVADAIRARLADTGAPPEKGDEVEESAKLYLHKIVQTTIPLPTLSRFDTQAFLLLLQLEAHMSSGLFEQVVEQCAAIRRDGGGLDDLEPGDGVDLSEELALASRLTPILYEKLHGNPRRIKRFLNDLRVRQVIAGRRGLRLDAAVVAKLMVLEVLLPEDFQLVLGWLAEGAMREKLGQLELAAGRPGPTESEATAGAEDEEELSFRPLSAAKSAALEDAADGFGEGLLRWAKLHPPLSSVDLASYLHLAASFSGVTLLDSSLPERLRDIAANLLSTARVDRQAVTDSDLDALRTSEAEKLLLHVGRTIRDDPTKQKTGVAAILRLAGRRVDQVATARKALLMLPADDLAIGTPLLFKRDDADELFDVLTTWRGQVDSPKVTRAIEDALKQRGSS